MWGLGTLGTGDRRARVLFHKRAVGERLSPAQVARGSLGVGGEMLDSRITNACESDSATPTSRALAQFPRTPGGPPNRAPAVGQYTNRDGGSRLCTTHTFAWGHGRASRFASDTVHADSRSGPYLSLYFADESLGMCSHQMIS